MAIDTAEKRRAVAGVPFGRGVTPAVAKDDEWRAQVAGAYFAAAAPTIVPVVPDLGPTDAEIANALSGRYGTVAIRFRFRGRNLHNEEL